MYSKLCLQEDEVHLTDVDANFLDNSRIKKNIHIFAFANAL